MQKYQDRIKAGNMKTEKIKTLSQPDWITIRTENEIISREYDVNEVYGNGIQVDVEVGKKSTDIYLLSQGEAVEWVILRWKESLIGKGRVLCDAWERGYGDLEWRGGGVTANQCMPWYFLTEYMGGFFCAGVKTNPSAMCFWQADTAGITLYLDVRCGGEGVLLGERRLKMCSVIWRLYDNCNAYDAASDFCSSMCSKFLVPKQAVYGGNNWYYAYGNTSAQDILRDTDYIVRLTAACSSRPYMILDDGWQQFRERTGYNGGPWRCGNERFPDMRALAEQMREKGVNPGIWIRPLLDQVSDLPLEWKLSHTGGLDPSHPDVLMHIKEDMKTICEWGYGLIKYDFVTYDLFGRWGFEMKPAVTDGKWHFYNRGLTSAEIVKMLYKEIWEAVRPYNVILLGCNAIGHLGAGYMHVNRIGDDISGKEWERTRNMGVNSLAFRLCQHNTFYLADADCVGITDKIPWDLNRQWADLIARSGTPLFVSAQPDVLNEAQNEELAQIFKMASENEHRAQPLDWMNNNCPELWADGERIIRYQWYE